MTLLDSSRQVPMEDSSRCSKGGQLKFLLFFSEVIAAGMSALCIYKCPYEPLTTISTLVILSGGLSLTGIFASFFSARKPLLIFFITIVITCYALMMMTVYSGAVGGCHHTRECYQLDDEDDEKDDDDGLRSNCEANEVRNDDDSDFSDGTFLAIKCLKDKVCDVNCGDMNWNPAEESRHHPFDDGSKYFWGFATENDCIDFWRQKEVIDTGKWLIAGAACMQLMMRCAMVWDTLHPQEAVDDQASSSTAVEGRFVDQADAVPQGHVVIAAATATTTTTAASADAKAKAVPSAQPIKTTTATATAPRR